MEEIRSFYFSIEYSSMLFNKIQKQIIWKQTLGVCELLNTLQSRSKRKRVEPCMKGAYNRMNGNAFVSEYGNAAVKLSWCVLYMYVSLYIYFLMICFENLWSCCCNTSLENVSTPTRSILTIQKQPEQELLNANETILLNSFL